MIRHPYSPVAHGATHQLYHWLLVAAGCERRQVDRVDGAPERDRGAVSLEQVLWFVAAGVAVAVIANVLWQRIADQADEDIELPESPTVGP
ncbi:MAG TPA: hypothetical protein VMM60_02825 [Ilumatobacter sp.]|nr:hypothetical protein [Ilumatobacter sp.]